ncbi:MAG: ester cyclase [Chloroflexi bacterium]|nr:ester cyclase [Chloroflexota bacterium]
MTSPDVEFTVRSYFSLMDRGHLSFLGHLTAPDYQLHFADVPEPFDLDGAIDLIAGFQTAFPDLSHDIRKVSETGGAVEVLITARGTQRGPFQGVPPSGRAVETPTRHRFRFANGKITEHWIAVDMADMMRQIDAGPATPEANKGLAVRLYEEVINQEDKAVIDAIFAPDVILHDPLTGTHQGVDACKGLLAMFDAAFPHHRVAVEAVLADGDYVTVLHTHYATHNGPFMGLAPTGKALAVGGLELFRFANGRIIEFWRKDDDVSLLMQLGALPAPQGA